MIEKMTRFLTVWVCVLALSLPAFADERPDKLLQSRAQEVFDTLQTGGDAYRSDFNKVYDLAERLIFPLVDFEAMGKLTLARHWRQATEQQRSDFISNYKALLVRTYTKSLREYANVNITFYPARTKYQDEYAMVYSDFVQGSGKPNIPVVYSMRKTANGWKAFDVTIEGLSMVKNYRDSLSREIDEKGLDGVIARLKKEASES
ncbi:MAG: phospholipid-binding protein MlaC [Thiotrichales bacterium]